MFKVFEGSMKYWSVPLKNYTESDTHFKPQFSEEIVASTSNGKIKTRSEKKMQ